MFFSAYSVNSSDGQQDDRPLSMCVVTASSKVRDAMARELENAGLACVVIDAQSNHTNAQNVVHLSTMHRAKGLESDCVAVLAPCSYLGDPEESANQRKLLYVALTRAKRGALLMQMP